MTISAKIIADSISPLGKRITTFQLRYPRFIHAEFMTHRVFSRNASSSRAIPVERMIADVLEDPAMPVHWGKNQKGMQADEEFGISKIIGLKANWLFARDQAVHAASIMVGAGLHKQIANRILEPWAHINVVVTATEYDNFFDLRCHKDAQPEIRVLAEAMRDAMRYNRPTPLVPGEYHLPYVKPEEYEAFYASDDEEWHEKLLKLSVARCARVSYLTQDGHTPTVEADLALYDRLVGGAPLHASPAEHQATPDEMTGNTHFVASDWRHKEQHGNFVGWRQYRRTIPGGIV